MNVESGWIGITADGYPVPLPCSLTPSHWLAGLHPNVHGFTLSDEQVRTDDYLRDAVPLVLEGELRGETPQAVLHQAHQLQQWVRQLAWLQRPGDGWATPLLEGSDLEFKPGANARKGSVRIVLVQERRVWYGPNGEESK